VLVVCRSLPLPVWRLGEDHVHHVGCLGCASRRRGVGWLWSWRRWSNCPYWPRPRLLRSILRDHWGEIRQHAENVAALAGTPGLLKAGELGPESTGPPWQVDQWGLVRHGCGERPGPPVRRTAPRRSWPLRRGQSLRGRRRRAGAIEPAPAGPPDGSSWPPQPECLSSRSAGPPERRGLSIARSAGQDGGSPARSTPGDGAVPARDRTRIHSGSVKTERSRPEAVSSRLPAGSPRLRGGGAEGRCGPGQRLSAPLRRPGQGSERGPGEGDLVPRVQFELAAADRGGGAVDGYVPVRGTAAADVLDGVDREVVE
jgi:hypothetical protein